MEFGAGVRVGAGITMGGIGINRRPMPTPLFDLNNIPPIITDSSLILHLDAGNSSSYSGSGQTWIDISGSGFDATITVPMASNFVQASAPYGYPNREGSHFDLGIEDSTRYGRIPYTAGIRPTEAITVEAFIYSSSWTSAFGSFFWLPNGVFFGYDGATALRMQINGSATNSGFPLIDQLGKWFHLVGTYDRSFVRTYLNSIQGNALAKTDAITYTAGVPAWIAGTNNSTPANPPSQNTVRGKLGVLRVYNRALTAAEIKNNYDAQKYRYGLT